MNRMVVFSSEIKKVGDFSSDYGGSVRVALSENMIGNMTVTGGDCELSWENIPVVLLMIDIVDFCCSSLYSDISTITWQIPDIDGSFLLSNRDSTFTIQASGCQQVVSDTIENVASAAFTELERVVGQWTDVFRTFDISILDIPSIRIASSNRVGDIVIQNRNFDDRQPTSG